MQQNSKIMLHLQDQMIVEIPPKELSAPTISWL